MQAFLIDKIKRASTHEARNKPPYIAGYLRRLMAKRCMKIHVKSNSAIESAFPLHIVLDGSVSPLKK